MRETVNENLIEPDPPTAVIAEPEAARNGIATNNGTATNGKPTRLPTGRLLPQHLADLQKSGLSPETIAACGFYSVQTPETVQKTLKWRIYRGQLGNCLAFPFRDSEGRPTQYTRLKPDNPRKAKEDGKPIRYESPKGCGNQAYFPPGTIAALKDPSQPLLITEGEKKAAAADQEGFPCIGLVGVFGWQKKRTKDKDGKTTGDRELIDSLVSLPWKGRAVFLCFDSDAAENPHVRRAEFHLAETLDRHGATVKVVRLPGGDPGIAKVGLDDFLLAQGPEEFRKLLAEARKPEKPLLPIEAADDPHRLARLYVRECCEHPEGLRLRHWREEWHRWDGSAYRIVPEKEVRAELTASAKAEMDRINLIQQKLAERNEKPPPVVRKVTGRLIADVAHALASLVLKQAFYQDSEI